MALTRIIPLRFTRKPDFESQASCHTLGASSRERQQINSNRFSMRIQYGFMNSTGFVKLPGHRPALPGNAISFYIVDLDPAYKAGLAGHVPVNRRWGPSSPSGKSRVKRHDIRSNPSDRVLHSPRLAAIEFRSLLCYILKNKQEKKDEAHTAGNCYPCDYPF